MGPFGRRSRTTWIDDGTSISVRIRVDTQIVAKMSGRASRAVTTLDDTDVGCGNSRGANHQKLNGEKYCGETSHAILSE